LQKKEPQDSYYVSPEIFDKQMAWLKANNYQVISYDTLYKALTSENSRLPSKAVVITFDDGVIDHYPMPFQY
jgi:peptidoglycan/xylan/chitin deacetylase (PgdA/CDA1 family)